MYSEHFTLTSRNLTPISLKLPAFTHTFGPHPAKGDLRYWMDRNMGRCSGGGFGGFGMAICMQILILGDKRTRRGGKGDGMAAIIVEQPLQKCLQNVLTCKDCAREIK